MHEKPGITLPVSAADNKRFAKLGGDMKNPALLTVDFAQTALKRFSERFVQGISINVPVCVFLRLHWQMYPFSRTSPEMKAAGKIEKIQSSFDSLKSRYLQRLISKGVVMADHLFSALMCSAPRMDLPDRMTDEREAAF